MISKIQITSEPSSLSSIEDYNEINQLRAIYVSAVEAVDPKRLIYDNLVFENNNLKYKNYTHEFSKPCYVVGFGKAVLGMALALDEILTDNILMGIVIVPVGTFTRFKNKPHMKPRKGTRIQYIEAGKDNIIDIHSVNATQKVINMVHNLKQDDLVLMLVSGGGSALLAMPNVQLHLKQKQELLIALSKAGADSKEINTVAKKLSRVKGGKLAEIIYPAEIICFILSDVIGDNLDFIASGPTMPCWDPPEGAVNVLKKYNLFSHLNKNIREVVFKDNIPSSIPIINSNFIHCHNVLVGSNRIAAEAAKTCAQNIGYATTILSNYVYGSVTAIAKIYAEMVELFSLIFKSEEGIEDDDLEERSKKLKPEKLIAQFLLKNRGAIGMNEKNIKDFENLKINGCRGICIICGGEPTLKVTGNGVGGRCQQLALQFSVEIAKINMSGAAEVTFLSCGTDGIDGPTDAAGAIGGPKIIEMAKEAKLDPIAYLNNNDCYKFYSRLKGGKYLIKVGHTGTNVMDIHVLLVTPTEANPTSD